MITKTYAKRVRTCWRLSMGCVLLTIVIYRVSDPIRIKVAKTRPLPWQALRETNIYYMHHISVLSGHRAACFNCCPTSLELGKEITYIKRDEGCCFLNHEDTFADVVHARLSLSLFCFLPLALVTGQSSFLSLSFNLSRLLLVLFKVKRPPKEASGDQS